MAIECRFDQASEPLAYAVITVFSELDLDAMHDLEIIVFSPPYWRAQTVLR